MAPVFSLRVLGLGVLTWVVPFVVSFLFIDRTGQVAVPLPLFKSIMVVVGGGVGAWLLVLAFRRIAPTLRSGLVLGFVWLAINVGLDLAVLVPMAGMRVSDWVIDIGLRYLLLPIFAAAMGRVGEGGRSTQPG